LANVKAQPSKFLSANNPANKFKNRLVNILPCKLILSSIKIQIFLFIFSDENTRVCLSPIRGVEGSDYINASYIDVS
jgi:netrin-G3 ligand